VGLAGSFAGMMTNW